MTQTAPALNVTGSGTSTSVTIPAGAGAGDYLLIHATSVTSLAAPSGWTLLASDGYGYVFGKRAAAGDPGSVVTFGTSLLEWQIEAWSHVGADSIVTATASASPAGAVTSYTATAGTVTTADANCTVVQTWVAANRTYAVGVTSTTATETQSPTIATVASDTYAMVVGYQTQASAGASTSETATFSYAGGGAAPPYDPIAMVTVALPPIQAPAAPTLLAPANGAYEDMSGAVTFTWGYNPTTGDGAQSAIQIRSKVAGAGSYSYWNHSTQAWQSTPITFAWSTQSYTFPAGAFSNGNIYNWSVATQEATESLLGAYATDFTVTAQALATVSIAVPSGSVATTTPTVTATVTPAAGASVTGYRVIVYTAAQVAAGGFTAGSGPHVYDSGTVTSSSTSISQAIPSGYLSNNATYYAYVAAEETGSEWSAWASSAFTVSMDAPATPTLTATAALTGLPSVTLTMTGHDNLASVADASFEGSEGTATAGSNTTIALSTTWAADGSESLKLTATASGDISVTEGPYTVTAGDEYTFTGAYHADTTGRTCRTDIAWYNGATHLSTTTGTTVTDVTSGDPAGTAAFPTATAPVGATSCYLVHNVLACGASESHYIDTVGVFPGAVTAWTRGGLAGATSALIQRSDDGGTTWATIRESNPEPSLGGSQSVTVTDIEPINVVKYRAAVDAGSGLVSPWSATVSASVTPTSWVLSDPTDSSTWLTLTRVSGLASTGTSLQIPASFNTTHPQAQGVFQAFGRSTAIVQLGDIYDGTVTFSHLISGYSDKATFDSLRSRNRVLQLRSDMGDSWYITLPATLTPTVLRATDRTNNPLYLLSGTCTIVDAP